MYLRSRRLHKTAISNLVAVTVFVGRGQHCTVFGKVEGARLPLSNCLELTLLFTQSHLAVFLMYVAHFCAVDIPTFLPDTSDSEYLLCQHLCAVGHSLGGALATLAAYDIKQALVKANRQDVELLCYSFGAPRTGNHAFAREYNQMVPDTWSIINNQVHHLSHSQYAVCLYACCILEKTLLPVTGNITTIARLAYLACVHGSEETLSDEQARFGSCLHPTG